MSTLHSFSDLKLEGLADSPDQPSPRAPSPLKIPFEGAVRIFQSELVKTIDEREPVSQRDAVRAACVLRYISYHNIADAFLGCAAINLLNAFANTTRIKFGYRFKDLLGPLLNSILENANGTVKVGYDNTGNQGLLLISFNGFQFSFKSRPLSDLTLKLSDGKSIPWDGIRKQMKAVSILNFALDSTWISNLTPGGQSLRDQLANEMDDFDSGCFMFRGNKLLKVSNIPVAKDMTDRVLKNYYREKLAESVGALVILRARYWATHPLFVTFGYVRPFIRFVETMPICDHINIHRPTLEKYMDVGDLQDNGGYYIIGYCEPYLKDRDRIGVELAEDLDHSPILKATDYKLISNNTFERSFQFGLESHLASGLDQVVYL